MGSLGIPISTSSVRTTALSGPAVHPSTPTAWLFGIRSNLSRVTRMRFAELFLENSFGAVYALEVAHYALAREGVYGETIDILKPVGVASLIQFLFASLPISVSLSLVCTNGTTDERNPPIV